MITKKLSRKTRQANAGFTLVEIMVVLVILGTLAALVFAKYGGVTDDAKRDTTKIQIRSLESTLAQFEAENGFFPTTEQGLDALITAPTTGREAKNYREGGYLARMPLDGWKNPFVYVSPGLQGAFDISSYGPDGLPGGDGKNADINNWELE